MVNVVSGVPQGSVLGSLLFLLNTSELFSILENKLIDYANGSTLMPVNRRKLNAKETIAHDEVSDGAMARKILKKIIDLSARIELILSILLPRP